MVSIWKVYTTGDYTVPKIRMKQIKGCSRCVRSSPILLEQLGIKLNASHAAESSEISQEWC